MSDKFPENKVFNDWVEWTEARESHPLFFQGGLTALLRHLPSSYKSMKDKNIDEKERTYTKKQIIEFIEEEKQKYFSVTVKDLHVFDFLVNLIKDKGEFEYEENKS